MVVARILAGAATLVYAVVGLTAMVAPRDGVLAIIPIVTPHLLLLTLLLVPLAAILRDRMVLLVALLGVGACLVMIGDEWLSWPSGRSDDAQIRLVSWNMEFGVVTPEDAVAALRGRDADVIALQELTHEAAAAIAADRVLGERYRHQALAPDDTVLGLGILSRYPITERTIFGSPSSLTVQLEIAPSTRLVVLNAHPLPGRITTFGFDAARRNEDLERLRARVQSLLDGDWPVVVIGDLNVASSEPAYAAFAGGLRDVHREAGFGPGWTWRPDRLAPLLRIDYVLVSQSLVPVHEHVDCDLPGDHCAVMASVALP